MFSHFSTTKHSSPQKCRLFTIDEVLQHLEDSDEDEREFDQTYPENDLESVEDESDNDMSQMRVCGSQSADGSGDAGDFESVNLFSFEICAFLCVLGVELKYRH